MLLPLAAPVAVMVAVTGPEDVETDTGARAAMPIAAAAASTAREYSWAGECRGQELRGHRQGEGRAQQELPVPAPHGAHEPVRDRAHAVGGGRHDRRARPRGRSQARDRGV